VKDKNATHIEIVKLTDFTHLVLFVIANNCL
jgi:hypothetical protein